MVPRVRFRAKQTPTPNLMKAASLTLEQAKESIALFEAAFKIKCHSVSILQQKFETVARTCEQLEADNTALREELRRVRTVKRGPCEQQEAPGSWAEFRTLKQELGRFAVKIERARTDPERDLAIEQLAKYVMRWEDEATLLT